ncbi:MAG TPA: response regulator transcription factor [Vicingus sp.]|nr:response regulator transcription factor [Flavobacteriales bacterium]MCL4856576.1 response regulator transcription factor [Flavobacteriales bacterium]HRN42449.1 response regulator transcription factor [Vicingus sp.]
MIDILIVNNNLIAGEGLKTILQSRLGNRVLGVVDSKESFVSTSKKYFPDIVVIDYSQPSFGVDFIADIKKAYKSTKILAITDVLPKQTIYKALKLGVDSYLLDDCDKPEILEAIEDTKNGKQFYCGHVIDILADKDDESGSCSGSSLSEREIEIIRMISDGLTNKEIADALCLSTHTVNTHRKNIMTKLGLKNTAGIVIYAFKENII